MTPPVLFTRKDQILKVLLNRTAVFNAVNSDLLQALQAGLTRGAQDSRVKVLWLQGQGGCFCAGADIKELAAMDEHRLRQFHDLRETTFHLLERFPVPTVAVIEKYALGTGLELALCCDFKIAAEDARLGVPSAKLGIVESYAYLTRLVRATGVYQAKKMIFTGEHVLAATALAIGLVEEVVPGDQLEARTAQLTAAMAANAGSAIRETKNVIEACARDPYLQSVADLARPMAASLVGAECKQRLTTFLNKQKSRNA